MTELTIPESIILVLVVFYTLVTIIEILIYFVYYGVNFYEEYPLTFFSCLYKKYSINLNYLGKIIILLVILPGLIFEQLVIYLLTPGLKILFKILKYTFIKLYSIVITFLKMLFFKKIK